MKVTRLSLMYHMFGHRLQHEMINNCIAISSEEGSKTLKRSRNEGQELFRLDCMDIRQNLVPFVEMHTLF